MKLLFLFLITPFFLLAQYPESEYSFRDLKNGLYEEDSTYIYTLPFRRVRKVWLIQGYDSKFSHQGEVSLDFKIKPGTKIYAARAGVVTQVKEDSQAGGLKDEYLSQGNHVVIQHADSTFAGYWHLQHEGALVAVGDTVAVGELIGLSGNTGYSAFPHLHFFVYGYDDNGDYMTYPTRFRTTAGVRYLRPGHFYKR